MVDVEKRLRNVKNTYTVQHVAHFLFIKWLFLCLLWPIRHLVITTCIVTS